MPARSECVQVRVEISTLRSRNTYMRGAGASARRGDAWPKRIYLLTITTIVHYASVAVVYQRTRKYSLLMQKMRTCRAHGDCTVCSGSGRGRGWPTICCCGPDVRHALHRAALRFYSPPSISRTVSSRSACFVTASSRKSSLTANTVEPLPATCSLRKFIV